MTLRSASAVLTFLVLTANPTDAQGASSHASALASDALPGLLKSLSKAAAEGAWGEIDSGLAPVAPPEVATAGERSEGTRVLLAACAEIKVRWNVDRVTRLRQAAQERDILAWRHAIALVAFDGIRAQIADNVRAHLRPREEVDERNRRLRVLFELVLQPLLPPDPASGELQNSASNIAYFLSRLESEDVLGQALAETRRVGDYADAGLGLLDELRRVIAEHDLAELAPSPSPGGGESPATSLDLAEADGLISISRALGQGASMGEWTQMVGGWRLQSGSLEAATAQLHPSARAAFQAREMCDVLEQLGSDDHRSLIWLSISERQHARLATALAVMGYEQIRLWLSENVRSGLSDTRACEERLEAARRVFAVVVEPWLLTLPKEQKDETVDAVRDTMHALALPADRQKEVVDEHGRQIVRLLRNLVEMVRRGVGLEFAGTAAVAGTKPRPPKLEHALIREGARLLLAGDALAASRILRQAVSLDSANEQARDLFEVANRGVADALGDVSKGDPFLSTSGRFLTLLARVRADVEQEQWIALRAGYTSSSTIQSGPATVGRDLRDLVCALLVATGRNRHGLLEAALMREDVQAMHQGLLILCFDACRAQIDRNLRDGMRDPSATGQRHHFLTDVANRILADAQDSVEPALAESVQAALAATVAPDVEDLREYKRRSLVLIEELLAVVSPLFRAAGQLEDGGSLEVIPEGPDLLATVRDVRTAVAAGAWKELEAGYREATDTNGPAADAGRRLADLQRLVASVFASIADSREQQIRRALERREVQHLEIGLVLLGFDSMRLDILRNSRGLLRPYGEVVQRNERIASVYHELIANLLESDAQLSAEIEARLRQLGSEELIGTPQGVAQPREPSLDAYGEAAVDLMELVTNGLESSETMATPAPEPFESADPDAFLGVVTGIREALARGHWAALRVGLTEGVPTAVPVEQQAAYASASELRRRVSDIDRAYETDIGNECLAAATAENARQLETALLALAYDSIRLKFTRNVGDGLEPSRLAVARGRAALAIYEGVLSAPIHELPGSGDSAGELRDARIRKRFERTGALEQFENAAEKPSLHDYLREVVPLLGEISSAVVLIEPEMPVSVRTEIEAEVGLSATPRRRRGSAPFRGDDPAAFLELARLLGGIRSADGWQQLAVGYDETELHSASAPDEHAAVDLGRRLRKRCDLVDSMRGTTRVDTLRRVIAHHDHESLVRAVVVLAVDTMRVNVSANVTERLAPRDRCLARNDAIRGIYAGLLRPIVLERPDAGAETGAEIDARIRGLLEEISSAALLSQPIEQSVPGYYQLARTALLDITSAVLQLPELEGNVAPARPAQPFETEDPERFLATVRDVRQAAATGRWGELLHGFQEGGADSELDTDAMRAGRDLRHRAEEVDERYARDRVGEMLDHLQEGDATGSGLDVGLIMLSFDLMRVKVFRNMRDRLRPYATAARRNQAIQAIYREVLRPFVVDSTTGGSDAAAEITAALEELDSQQYMGTDPATDVDPALEADPIAYGDAATRVLLRLSGAIGGADLAPEVGTSAGDDPEWDKLAKKYNSYSDDFYVVWGVDAFRVAVQLGREGDVLKGLREGGKIRPGDPKAVSAGRAIHGTCALINRIVGNDLLPQWDAALAARDREILNRLLVLTAFEVIRLKLNDNIGTGLKDYQQCVQRQKDARIIYDSVCRVAVYGPEQEDMLIGRLQDQLIGRRWDRLASTDLIGRAPQDPGDPRRVDVAGYRQAAVELLEFLLTAISDPEKAIERYEGQAPRPFELPIERK